MNIETPRQPEKTDIGTPTATEAAQVLWPETKSREGFTKKQKIIGTILALGGLTGGAVAANHFSSTIEAPVAADQNKDIKDATPSLTSNPEVSASATPTNITPLETAPVQLNSIEIKVGQTPEALAKNLFEDVFPKWNMSGTNKETEDEINQYVIANGDSQLANHYKELAAKNSQPFKKAIFGESLTERQTELANDYTYVNAWILNMHYLTSDDQEAYKVWNTVESAELSSKSGTLTTIRVEYTEHDNSTSGLNRAGKLIANSGPGKALDGKKHIAAVTFDSASGSEKITGITLVTPKQ